MVDISKSLTYNGLIAHRNMNTKISKEALKTQTDNYCKNVLEPIQNEVRGLINAG